MLVFPMKLISRCRELYANVLICVKNVWVKAFHISHRTQVPQIYAAAFYVINIPLKRSQNVLNLCGIYHREHCGKNSLCIYIYIACSEAANATAFRNRADATDLRINCGVTRNLFPGVSLRCVITRTRARLTRGEGIRNGVIIDAKIGATP